VCGQVLVTVRETFAVAPGLSSARVAVLRQEAPDAYGRPKVSCIAAVKLDRGALAGIKWDTADAVQIVNEASADQAHNQRGRSKGLSPIDLTDEPDLAQLVQAIDFTDDDIGEPVRGDTGAVPAAVVAVGAATVSAGSRPPVPSVGPQSPSRSAVGLKRPIVKALLIVGGVPIVLCIAIATVSAAMGINDENRSPARTTSGVVVTQAPSRTPAGSGTSAGATSGTNSTATSAATTSRPARLPPPQTANNPPPPPPPPPPPAPATQRGVHPGAFCSPKWSYGLTSAGTLMQCKPSATDSRFRWRKA
jgi:hypothetical protein